MRGKQLRDRLVEINRERRARAAPEPPIEGGEPSPPSPFRLESGGEYQTIEFDAADLDAVFAPLAGRLARALPLAGALDEASPALRALAGRDPRSFLYLDLETTGLTSAGPLFLVGALRLRADRFVIRQYFARNYAEEPPLLRDVARDLTEFDGLVTFNGKSYDIPYLRDRACLARVDLSPPDLHVDLLHEARRRLRGRLPDCRLQTLEAHLCGRRRAGDLPGAEIPAAYHDFVRTGDTSLMELVLRHNALDLVAMAEIALALVELATGERPAP